jgi:hypothetical protein
MGEWNDVTPKGGRYEIQVTIDGRMRHRPKFFVIGKDAEDRPWTQGQPPLKPTPRSNFTSFNPNGHAS